MYYYIVNPAAGGAKIDKIQDRLKARLSDLGIMGEFVKTTGPDDVAKLTRMGIEKGYKTIVAVGGDGTINEVMNELIDNPKVVLGIIPTGTTNDLADALGIRGWFSAASILASRKVEEIDLGRVGERYFVTSATMGFDAEFAKDKRLSKGNAFEKIRYATKLLSRSAAHRPVRASLKFDNDYEVDAEIFSIVVSNSKFFPLKFIKTEPNDNLLDTVVITKIPGYKMLQYGYLSDLSSVDLPKISVFHSREIEIVTKKPKNIAIDGQISTKTPIKITMTDKKLKVIVSRKRKF
ncbi:MAG: YegS/Rv2252/BmrU family lipid kinase [Patescibacteria group bacterium]|nr:YegS/Rv2252/BmrU family lipid kinase [Patescibacteria group bacterium]